MSKSTFTKAPVSSVSIALDSRISSGPGIVFGGREVGCQISSHDVYLDYELHCEQFCWVFFSPSSLQRVREKKDIFVKLIQGPKRISFKIKFE